MGRSAERGKRVQRGTRAAKIKKRVSSARRKKLTPAFSLPLPIDAESLRVSHQCAGLLFHHPHPQLEPRALRNSLNGLGLPAARRAPEPAHRHSTPSTSSAPAPRAAEPACAPGSAAVQNLGEGTLEARAQQAGPQGTLGAVVRPFCGAALGAKCLRWRCARRAGAPRPGLTLRCQGAPEPPPLLLSGVLDLPGRFRFSSLPFLRATHTLPRTSATSAAAGAPVPDRARTGRRALTCPAALLPSPLHAAARGGRGAAPGQRGAGSCPSPRPRPGPEERSRGGTRPGLRRRAAGRPPLTEGQGLEFCAAAVT